MPSWKAPASWTKWVCRAKPAVSANQLGVSSAAMPAAVMNSPASRVTARTKRRPRSVDRAGDHPPVGFLIIVWLWVLMALVPRECHQTGPPRGADQSRWRPRWSSGRLIGGMAALIGVRLLRIGRDQLPPAPAGVAGIVAQVTADRRGRQGRLQPLVDQLLGDRALGHQGQRSSATDPGP
jgi:hypothetical protein